jgi:polygalacturonase
VLDGNGGQAQYKGQTILSQVEFYKMGQLNNLNAALRFENSNQADASTTKSSVDGVVIHESVGWGISVVLSSNISLRNIDVFAVSQIGVSLDQTTNVSADSVNVFGV